MDRFEVTRTDLWVTRIAADGAEGPREPVCNGPLDARIQDGFVGIVAFHVPLFAGLEEIRVPRADVLLAADGAPGPLLHLLVDVVRANEALKRRGTAVSFADVRPLEERVAAYLAAAHEAWA